MKAFRTWFPQKLHELLFARFHKVLIQIILLCGRFVLVLHCIAANGIGQKLKSWSIGWHFIFFGGQKS